MANATNDDLKAMHADWRLALNSQRSLLRIASEQRALGAWEVLRSLVIGLGEFVLLLGLSLRNLGRWSEIHEKVHPFADHVQRLASDQT